MTERRTLRKRGPDQFTSHAVQKGTSGIYRERAMRDKASFDQTQDYGYHERHQGNATVANIISASTNKVDALLRLTAAKTLLAVNHISPSEDITVMGEAIEELQASIVDWGEVSHTKPTLGDILVTFLIRASNAHRQAHDLQQTDRARSDQFDIRFATYLRAASALLTWGEEATAGEFVAKHEGLYALDKQAADEIKTAMIGFHAGEDMPDFIIAAFRKQPSQLRRRFDSIRASFRHRRERQTEKLTEKTWQGGILGTEALKELVDTTDFVTPKPEKIDAQSFDVHLGSRFTKVTGPIIFGQPLDPSQVEEFILQSGETLILGPGDYLLGETAEKFKFPPELFGQIETNGGPARAFVVAELDKHVDGGTGWNKEKEKTGEPYEGMPITLQLINHRTGPNDTFEITVGDPIGRMEVFTTVGKVEPYKGKYNRQGKGNNSHQVYKP